MVETERRRETYGLSQQEMCFVLDYISDFDGGRAYASYYVVDEEDNPNTLASRLLADPRVQSAIAEEIKAQGALLFLTKEALIARTWQEALNPRNKAAEKLKAIELTAKLSGFLDSNADKTAQPSLSITISDPSGITMTKKENGKEKVQTVGFNGPTIDIGPVIEKDGTETEDGA